jgi:hypothetical protein
MKPGRDHPKPAGSSDPTPALEGNRRDLYVFDDGTATRESIDLVLRLVSQATPDAGRIRWISLRPRRVRRDVDAPWISRLTDEAMRSGIRLLVQDDADLALDLAWDGVELASVGRSVSVARDLLGPERVVVVRHDGGSALAAATVGLADVVLCVTDGPAPRVEWPTRLALGRDPSDQPRSHARAVSLGDAGAFLETHELREHA